MKTTHIGMWSGPRNISTALMRSFENREDTTALDEPFYTYYLDKTGIKHPGRELIMKSQNSNWSEVSELCIGKIPEGKKIWYQKHMAQHLLDNNDLSWILNLKNCLLIRDPKAVINSFKKEFPVERSTQLGYPQQLKIYNYVKERTGFPPIIIDAKDILRNPEKMLKKLCSLLKMPFSINMLSWPKGKRETDGVWAPYWYEKVEKSTKFNKYKEPIIELEKDLYDLYDECMVYYQELFEFRLKL